MWCLVSHIRFEKGKDKALKSDKIYSPNFEIAQPSNNHHTYSNFETEEELGALVREYTVLTFATKKREY